MPYRFISNRAGAAPYHNGRMREKEAFAAANYAKCQQLGFAPETSITTCVSHRCSSNVLSPNQYQVKPQQFPHRREPLVAIDPEADWVNIGAGSRLLTSREVRCAKAL